MSRKRNIRIIVINYCIKELKCNIHLSKLIYCNNTEQLLVSNELFHIWIMIYNYFCFKICTTTLINAKKHRRYLKKAICELEMATWMNGQNAHWPCQACVGIMSAQELSLLPSFSLSSNFLLLLVAIVSSLYIVVLNYNIHKFKTLIWVIKD